MYFDLYVCLFGVFVLIEKFSLISGNITFTGVRLQMLTYARHLWPFSIEDSLGCHNYCDTGHPFIMVISEDLWQPHLLPSVWHWSHHYLFLRLKSVATFRLRGEHSKPLRRRCGHVLQRTCNFRRSIYESIQTILSFHTPIF